MEMDKVQAALESQYPQHGFTIVWYPLQDLEPRWNGSTRFTDHTTRIDPRQSPMELLDTTAHELGHIVLRHTPRYDGWFETDRRKAETEAQMFAYLVLEGLGIDNREWTEQYLFDYDAGYGWSDPDMVNEVIGNVYRPAAQTVRAMKKEMEWIK